MNELIKKLAYWDGEGVKKVFASENPFATNKNMKLVQEALNSLLNDNPLTPTGIMDKPTMAKINKFLSDNSETIANYRGSYFYPTLWKKILEKAKQVPQVSQDAISQFDYLLEAINVEPRQQNITQQQTNTQQAQSTELKLPSGSYAPFANDPNLLTNYQKDLQFVEENVKSSNVSKAAKCFLLENFWKKYQPFKENLQPRSSWLRALTGSAGEFAYYL